MLSDEAQVPPYELPDPLLRADGSRVTTAAEWRDRRREILALFAEQIYGQTPALAVEATTSIVEADAPALGGAGVRRQTRLRLLVERRPIEVDLLDYRPARAPRPTPAIIAPNFHGNHTVDVDPAVRISERARHHRPDLPSARGIVAHRLPLTALVARGFRCVTFYYGDVVADAGDLGGESPLFPRGCGGREPSEWGAIGAWAWGTSRVLDYLWNDTGVDRDRMVLAGHSRLGKAALWAAAQDERVAAVFANNSGCTGAAIARRCFGETIASINSLFPHWFCRNYHAYAGREPELPVDQHQLIAAIAPRQVYIASAAEDLWADPHGEFLGALHAGPVYRLLGSEGLIETDWPPAGESSGGVGYHLRAGGHDLLASDWDRFLDFVTRARL